MPRVTKIKTRISHITFSIRGHLNAGVSLAFSSQRKRERERKSVRKARDREIERDSTGEKERIKRDGETGKARVREC